MKKVRTAFSADELRELQDLPALWRPTSDFVGPVGPPMVIWLNDREAQQRWLIKYNLCNKAAIEALEETTT